MNVVRAYAYFRAYILALILWAVVWITALVMMSQPGDASSFGIFGLFLACIFLGSGFFGALYFALPILSKLGRLRPLVVVALWTSIPVVTLFIRRFGEWDEAIAAGFAGTIAGCAFLALSRSAELDANES
jgi:hypothetical protein